MVVLPQPDSPAIPSASPSSRVKLTSSTAWTVCAPEPEVGREPLDDEERGVRVGLLRERPLAPPAAADRRRRRPRRRPALGRVASVIGASGASG